MNTLKLFTKLYKFVHFLGVEFHHLTSVAHDLDTRAMVQREAAVNPYPGKRPCLGEEWQAEGRTVEL